MKFFALFIYRPVATILLSVAITLCGILGFRMLPVAPLPQVDFPVIMVSASLPGASPETMASSVATPLERSLGRIAGVSEMTSSSSLGSTRIILQFDFDRDINGAARDVQAAINAAQSLLPSGMPSRPTYRKANPSDAPIMILTLTSDTYSQGELYDFATTQLAPTISQIDGVGDVDVGGSSLPAVRVGLNPQALFNQGVSLDDVRTAVSNANVRKPQGALEDGTHRWQIQTNDELKTAAEYQPLIIHYNNGGAVRLGDVATVTDSVQDVRNAGMTNAKPAILLMIRKLPEANIIQTVDSIRAKLPELQETIPAAIDLQIAQDRSPTIRASLEEVEQTLIISVALVILVVFLFLRSGRATIIPAVSVPVSLIGTFAAMYLCGFSLNNLSLMALTIATGFVVDDAIVYPLSEGRYFVVLNVGKGERIAESLSAWAASEGKSVTIRDLAGTYGKLDLQGPATVRVMTKLLKDPEAVFDKLPYFSFKGDIELANSDIFLADGTPIFLSRTGYTGEQGFEIFVPYDKIVDIWNRILEAGKDEGVIPCGLAARDSVRAGAVLPLSQQDIGPWAFVNNPWPFTLPKDENGNWTKNFFGRSALEEALASGNVTYTYAYCGFDPRKVTSPDHDTHPQVLLDGEVIGDVLTCVADVSIGRVDGVITSVASPEKPEGFAPKGLVCGFVRVNRPLENGTKLTLADPRRKIQVETVTDIRPARTARKKLGSL